MTVATDAALLIVDDHADTGAMLARLAAKRGIGADVVLSGLQAIQRIVRNHTQIVILDEMMPDMSGLEALQAIRNDPRTADVKVIFYSACFDWEKQRDAFRLGALAWYVKGVSRLSDLIDKVQECMKD